MKNSNKKIVLIQNTDNGLQFWNGVELTKINEHAVVYTDLKFASKLAVSLGLMVYTIIDFGI